MNQSKDEWGPHGSGIDTPTRQPVRIGNVEEKSDLHLAKKFTASSMIEMEGVAENLSVHDHPEMRQRALEFIRRLQEFQKMLEKGTDR